MRDFNLILEDVERLYGFFPKVLNLGVNNQDASGEVSLIRHSRNFALIFDDGLKTAGYLVDGMRVECSTPALVYVEPSVHAYCQVNARPCRKLYIRYPETETFFRGRCRRTGLPVLSTVVITDTLRKLICEIATAAQDWHGIGMADRIDALCANFILEMLLGRPEMQQEEENVDVLWKIRNYIRSHCMEWLDYQELARRNGMSQRSLIRKWEKEYQMAPKQFQMQCRLEAAGNYLKDSDLPIGEIAAMTGYCDQFAFARAFRKGMGITPTEWRKHYSR